MASRSDIMAGRAFVELYVKKEGLTQGLANARQRLQDFGNAANALGRTMMAMGIAAGVGIAAAGQRFIAFDDQMRAVKAAVGGTEPEFKRLTQVAKELGRASGTSAVQVGALMLELGRAGFNPTQIEQMTGAVLSLSKATGTDAARSSEIMTAAIKQFNLPATDASRVADGLTAAANMSATSVEALGEALSYAGPVAESLGMSLEDALAVMGSLGNIGIQGSEAGTTLRRLMTLTAADAAKMSQLFGVAFTDAKGNALPLIDVLENVNNATKHLGSATRAAKFNEAFGILGIVGASSLGKAAGSVRKLSTDIKGAGGIADKTAKEMESGPGGALRRLIVAIEGAAIAFSEGLAPAFDVATGYANAFATTVTKVFEQNQGLALGIAKTAAGLMAGGAALLAIGTTAKAAAFGLGVLQVALTPAAYGAGILLAGLKNMGIATASVIRGVQGLASVLGSGLVGALNLARVGLSNVVASAVSMAGGLARAAMSAGNAIRAGLVSVIARVPAAFNGIVAASRVAFAGMAAAAAKGSTELRYWLSRPFEYFKALAPLLAQDLQLAMANAMGRIKAASAIAADGMLAAWTAASARVSAAMSALATSIASRFTSVASPIGAKLSQAFGAAMSAVSAKAAAAWSAVAGSANSMLNRLKQRFATIAPLIGQDLARIAGYASSAARGVVSAFVFAGPAIARGLTSAASAAFTRIRAMGAATAGMMGRGIGAGARGIGGALTGVAGLMSMVGGGAGGMLGKIAGIAPQLLMIGSSMAALINPATLMIAAIGGGIYLWTQYSEEGKAALAAVMEAFAPLVKTVQQTFAGISTAIQSGNLALAGKIAIAGLKLAFLDGMQGIGDLIGGPIGKAFKLIGGKIAGGDFKGAWKDAVASMGAMWDAFSAGIVKTFSRAMSFVVDMWKAGSRSLTDFLLEASAGGDAVASAFLGVDMKDEKQREGVKWELQQRNLQHKLKQHEDLLAKAESNGDTKAAEAQRRGIESTKAELAKGGFQVPENDFMKQAKAAAHQEFELGAGNKIADQVKAALKEYEEFAAAKAQNSADNLAPQLGDVDDKVRKGLEAALASLVTQANEEKERKEREGEPAPDKPVPGVAGGGPDAAGVKGMLEAKSMGATFSAAAAIAMGRGGAAGNPQERAAKAAEKQVDLLKEQKELLEDQKMVFKVMGEEVAKNREVAEGDQELLVNIANEIRDLNVGLE